MLLVFCHTSCFEGYALFRVSAKERKRMMTNKINTLLKESVSFLKENQKKPNVE